MIDVETLQVLSDFGALAVLGLFIIVGGITMRSVISLFKTSVLPLVTGHLTHIEESFSQLAAAYDQQTTELSTHNELTQSLVEQVRLQNNLLTGKLMERKPATARRKKVS